MSEQAETKETPKPTHVVLDNTNVAAILADARGEEYVPETPKEEPKAEPKAESKEVGADEEDENGLTAEEKKDLTEKMQKAIGKKHRALMTEKEFAQEQYNVAKLAERRASELERENARLKEQLTPPKVEEVKEPNRADFKTDKDYADAMIDYRVDQKLKAKEAEDHQKAVEERQRETVAQAQARIEKAKELVPDWNEVMEAADMAVPETVAGYMQESEMFAELGYHLAKNPQVLERLAKLSPARQLVEIGKIEGTLKPFEEKSSKAEGKQETATPVKDGKAETPPSTNGNPPSKARPEPIKPLETGSASQVEKPASEMTYAEARARFEKRHKVNFGARQRH